MSATSTVEEIRDAASALPTQAKWELANVLYEQVEADPTWPLLPREYFEELDRRVAEYLLDPSKGSTWEDVKARILASEKMAEVVILLGAEIQTQEIFAGYEDFREGKGVEFLEALERAYTVLRMFPEAAPHFAHGYRRWVLVKYQKGIFYRVEGARVMIADVLDLRQDPEAILRRFRPR